MSELKIFEREEFGAIRAVVAEDGEPMFVATDVAKALGYSNPSEAVRDHCKKVNKISIAKSATPYSIIPESDVYRLIMRSNLPTAEKFQDWVCEEVLPSIRKTGQYSVQLSPAEFLLQQAQLLVEVERKTNKALELAASTSKRLDNIETAHDHFTVLGYCRQTGRSLALKAAQHYGKLATRFCREAGIEMGEVPDPRFGRTNTYPAFVLRDIFEDA